MAILSCGTITALIYIRFTRNDGVEEETPPAMDVLNLSLLERRDSVEEEVRRERTISEDFTLPVD